MWSFIKSMLDTPIYFISNSTRRVGSKMAAFADVQYWIYADAVGGGSEKVQKFRPYSPKRHKLIHLICTSSCLLLRVFDQDDEIGDPQGWTVVTQPHLKMCYNLSLSWHLLQLTPCTLHLTAQNSTSWCTWSAPATVSCWGYLIKMMLSGIPRD